MRMALSKHGHKIELHRIKNSTSSHLVSLNAIYKFQKMMSNCKFFWQNFQEYLKNRKGFLLAAIVTTEFPWSQVLSRQWYARANILMPKKMGLMSLMDYRELNVKEVKDKFQLPVIDELLKEFGGAKFFTKLDMRSGYHQVRMFLQTIKKTTFCIHHDHFEFLVMPVGLINAPSTFQTLMNEVFQPYLRKFVLVFFDDILIYNRTWIEHLYHLRIVFEVFQLINYS